MYEYHYHTPTGTYYRRPLYGPARWQMFKVARIPLNVVARCDRMACPLPPLRGHWVDIVAPPEFDDMIGNVSTCWKRHYTKVA